MLTPLRNSPRRAAVLTATAVLAAMVALGTAALAGTLPGQASPAAAGARIPAGVPGSLAGGGSAVGGGTLASGYAPAAAVPGHLVPAAGQAPRQACSTAGAGQAACQVVINPSQGKPLTASAAAAARLAPTPQPYLAADLQSAYSLPSKLLGAGHTVAVVDAYDDPNAAADLAAYRAENHLPACGASCFRKVAQDGSTSYPVPDASWSAEMSLDLDMVSATCPNCKILLVEAYDNSVGNLGAAVDEAVKLHATVVSNSYGASEYTTEQEDAGHWHHPGTVLVASTGDAGFGVEVPAAFPSVVSVGGTALYHAAGARGWAERAWSFGGSGCSAYFAKPAWQPGTQCGMRSVADLAAVADPDTPVWIYDSYGTGGTWFTVGGTSVAAPIIAGAYALAGNTPAISPAQYLAQHHSQLSDVTSGANGYCGGGWLCTAGPGFDGPTGWGTPHGIGAF